MSSSEDDFGDFDRPVSAAGQIDTTIWLAGLLADDSRKGGLGGHLYVYDDVSSAPPAEWSEANPVIVPRKTKVSLAPKQTACDIMSKFLERVPKELLYSDKPVYGRPSGLLPAGGAVASALVGRDYQCSDLDLFIVGWSREEATQAINCLPSYLCGKGGKWQVFRTNTCISFVREEGPSAGPNIIQVVLRRYDTAASVIHDFDLGSSAVAYFPDCREFVFAPAARFAYANGCNVLNMAKRRHSYEYRLHKYYNRGFGIVLYGVPESVLAMADADPLRVGPLKFRAPVQSPRNRSVYVSHNFEIVEDKRARQSALDYTPPADLFDLDKAVSGNLKRALGCKTIPAIAGAALSQNTEPTKLLARPSEADLRKALCSMFTHEDLRFTAVVDLFDGLDSMQEALDFERGDITFDDLFAALEDTMYARVALAAPFDAPDAFEPAGTTLAEWYDAAL